MTVHRITVDRLSLTLAGLPAAQAEVLAAQLQAAMAAQPWPTETAPDLPETTGDPTADPTTLDTRLAGPELVHAVAARLMHLIAAAAAPRTPQEAAPWP